jgi:hypothetical protein
MRFALIVAVAGLLSSGGQPAAKRYVGDHHFAQRDGRWYVIDEHGEEWQVAPGRIFVKLSQGATLELAQNSPSFESLSFERRLPAARVIQVLERLEITRGLPRSIVVDNGPEFRSQALDEWAYRRGVQIDFIEPGKPVQNPFVESLNGKMRDECLNQNWTRDVPEARVVIEEYRQDFNEVRPHSSLGQKTPSEFARTAEWYDGVRSTLTR